MPKTNLNVSNDKKAGSGILNANEENKSEMTMASNDADLDNCKRKLRNDSIQDDLSDDDDPNVEYDREIERRIRDVAQKNNINELAVRHILRKVVRNDHVLAHVKLKEEELLKQEEREAKESIPITRQKAKELNQSPLPIKAPQAKSEVAALIDEEMHSDEEDDEYQPGEEELNSDDDINTTASDIDSQPRTPATPYMTGNSQDGDGGDGYRENYTDDGLFKIPLSPDKFGFSPAKQQAPGEEIIARRTRSKVCLTETPIEQIESTFIPPDITTDMYDFDPDLDNEWLEFLSDFTKPLSKETGEVDDDEGDPEYVAADAVPIDKEELRDPKVSKKELNDLIKEFCDIVGLFDCDHEAIETLEKLQDTLEIPGAKSSTSPSKSPTPEKILGTAVNDPVEQNVNFIPSIMSTPNYSKAFECFTQPKDITLTSSTTTTTNLITHQDIIQSPIIIANDFQFSGIVYQNGVFQMQPQSTELCTIQMPPPPVPLPPTLNMTDDHKNEQIKSRAYVTMEKRYSYLNNLPPKVYDFPPEARGFVGEQKSILAEQLRMHVQMLAQNFMQTFGHPQLYKYADKFMGYLKELERYYEKNVVSRPDTMWSIWNLKPAIEICTTWMTDLAVDNKTNRRYLEFLNSEISRVTIARQKNTFTHCRLPIKLQHVIIESNVFMYPKLLPTVGFGIGYVSRKIKHHIIASEGVVFAHELERSYTEMAEEIPHNKKPQTLFSVCQRMAKNLHGARNEDIIYAYVRAKRDKSCPMNPIKYYMENKRAPPVQHDIVPIDFFNVLSPQDQPRDALPELWEKFKYSNSRLRRIHNAKLIALGLEPEYIASDDEDFFNDGSVRQPKFTPIKFRSLEDNKPAPVVKIVVKTLPRNEFKEFRVEQHSKNSSSAQLVTHNTELAGDQSPIVSVSNQGTPNHPTNDSLSDGVSDTLSRVSFYAATATSSRSLCSCCTHTPEEKFVPPIFLPKGQKLLTDFFPVKNKELPDTLCKEIFQITPRHLGIKFTRFIENFKTNYDEFYQVYELHLNPSILEVYNYFKTIDIFTTLLIDLKMNPNFEINVCDMEGGLLGGDSGLTTLRIDGQQFQNRQIISLDGSAESEKDHIYAQNFFEKVRDTMLANNNRKDYETFHNILLNFDFETETVPDLYYKLEKLFYPRYQELAELFLTFLLPGHAAQVGKFFEHFMLTNMSTFINKLNVYFSRQPTQIRKIYTCLNELAASTDVTMESIKVKILPLLKGNPILTDWFVALFPNEKPGEPTASDYETVNVEKNQQSDDISDNVESFEKIPASELFPDTDNSGGCGIKFLHGRIFYGNRVLLPAKLSFLAYEMFPPTTSATASLSSDLYTTTPNIHPEDIDLKCVHNIRNLIDNNNAIGEDVNSSLSSSDEPDENGRGGVRIKQPLPFSPVSDDASYEICDDAELRMHAIRINPIVHGNRSFGEASNDWSGHQNHHHKDESTDASLKNSPRRTIKKPISPQTKKSTMKSPPMVEIPMKHDLEIPSTSQALATAKRLKILVEEEDGIRTDDDDRPLSERLKQSGNRGKKRTKAEKNSVDDMESDEVKGRKAQKRRRKANKKDEGASKKKSTPDSWTRDEDKLILELIESGVTDENDLVENVRSHLEKRSPQEIVERYGFLMEILKQFQINTDD